nr:hypothetical protein [uncultured Kingella sp.]
MNKENLRRTIKQFLSTLTTVGVMATAPAVYGHSVQKISPELTIQKLANYPTNREARRKLTTETKNAFSELYRHLSVQFSQKFQKFADAVQLFSSLLSDIAMHDNLKKFININDLVDIRNDIQQSIEQFKLLDRVLITLEKITGEQDIYQIHSLFGKIIEAEEQTLHIANQFYATFYHQELEKIVEERQEVAFVFDETHSRDDIRRMLFGDS